eukprot:143825_1
MPADCYQCGKPNATSMCGGCKIVFYCNVKCQRANWKTHKKQCKMWRAKTNKSKENGFKIKNKQQLRSLIEKLTQSYVTIDQADPKTAEDEAKVFNQHNKLMKQLFDVAAKIKLSSNFNQDEKFQHLQYICDTICEYDNKMCDFFESEIPEQLFTNNDGSILMESSLKQCRPAKSLVSDIVSRIHSGQLDLNDEMKLSIYMMYKAVKSEEFNMILQALRVAETKLGLKYGIFGDKNNAKGAKKEIEKIIEFIDTNIFVVESKEKRPDGASKYVRFDKDYISKECFSELDILLFHGYIRSNNKLKTYNFPRVVIELCIRYYCKNNILENVYSGKLKFNNNLQCWSSDCYGIDCSYNLLTVTGGTGWKNRHPSVQNFYFNIDGCTNNSTSYRGFSTPGYIIYADGIHNRFWNSGDHRVKCSGIIDQNGKDLYCTSADKDDSLSCEYILDVTGHKEKRLFTTKEKVFLYGNGSFVCWDFNKLNQHITDYLTECCDDDDIPSEDENGIKTRLYSIFDESYSEGDETYEVSGGDTYHNLFEINTKRIGENNKFESSMISIPNNMNTFNGQVYVTNKNGIYLYDMNKENISGIFLGHNTGNASLSFRQYLIDSNNLVVSRDYRMVKIWDIRTSKPTISIKACGNNNLCSAIGFNANGNAFIASGGNDEAISIWDIRKVNKNTNNSSLYEISTGNTCVMQIIWHKGSQSLFARVDCSYIDRMGNRYYGDDWDYDDEYQDEENQWPSKAKHKKDDFACQYDAGSNGVFRYQF